MSEALSFLDVACAIVVDASGRVLCAQRGPGMDNSGKWEFPGGKVEAGESPEACIRREMLEETGLEIEVQRAGPAFLSMHGERRILRLLPFVCVLRAGVAEAREHSELRWCSQAELEALDWAVADIGVVAWWGSAH